MIVATGIDIGSSSIKFAAVRVEEGSVDPRALGGGVRPEGIEVVGVRGDRIRRRDPKRVVKEGYQALLDEAGIGNVDVGYVATTGDADAVSFRTGHFYGMTTHARGALFIAPEARADLDLGALHARAIAMDERGRVLDYKMTSQCASGSGQFLENISRYLGVSQAEIGSLSLEADDPERVSSICAVLAETDVINMVSQKISTPNILRGIHESMAERFVGLLRSLNVEGTVCISGGLATDIGLVAAIGDELARDPHISGRSVSLTTHPLSQFAGAIGAAIWGGFRHRKLALDGVAWAR